MVNNTFTTTTRTVRNPWGPTWGLTKWICTGTCLTRARPQGTTMAVWRSREEWHQRLTWHTPFLPTLFFTLKHILRIQISFFIFNLVLWIMIYLFSVRSRTWASNENETLYSTLAGMMIFTKLLLDYFLFFSFS